MTKHSRSDGKRINKKISNEVVAAIKALAATVPAKLLASIFDIYISSVYMIANGKRRANIQAMKIEEAKRLLARRFNQMLNSQQNQNYVMMK